MEKEKKKNFKNWYAARTPSNQIQNIEIESRILGYT